MGRRTSMFLMEWRKCSTDIKTKKNCAEKGIRVHTLITKRVRDNELEKGDKSPVPFNFFILLF